MYSFLKCTWHNPKLLVIYRPFTNLPFKASYCHLYVEPQGYSKNIDILYNQLHVLPLDAATALLSSAMIKGGCMATKKFRQVPKMEVLHLIAGYFGGGFYDFPLHKPYPYSFYR